MSLLVASALDPFGPAYSARLLAVAVSATLDKAIALRSLLTSAAEAIAPQAPLAPFLAFCACSLCYATVALFACMPAPYGPGSRHALGSGIPELQAILSGYWLARYLSFTTFVSKVIGLIAALAAGYYIGREGPMVHLSAALSVLLMKLPWFEQAIEQNHQRKRCVASSPPDLLTS